LRVTSDRRAGRIVQVADIATAQSFTSHSNRDMIAYYSHASSKSREDAMQKMYGKKDELTEDKLKVIFEKVQKKKMKFEEFLTIILG
jgi:hypothetical protein